MPKLKTSKSIRKRFRVTKKGKVIGSSSMKRHLLTDRSSKKKRQLRNPKQLDWFDAKHVKKLLPYG